MYVAHTSLATDLDWLRFRCHGQTNAQRSPTRSRDHVRAGDVLHPVVGHTRWTAATREVVRQWWGRDPQFTLVMLSLSSLGALFFRGGLVRKVITGYSGDTFPNFTPNPWFAGAYERGEVEVEHWSFLAFAQRLEAAARGLPAIVDPLDRGIVDGGERGVRRGSTRRSARSGCSRRCSPTSRPARARRRPRRQRRAASAAARRGVGRARRAPRARSSPSSGSSTTSDRGRISSASLRTACSRSWSARWARIPAAVTPATLPVERLRRGLRLLGRRARGDAARRLRRVDPALGARGRDAGAVDRAARRRARRERCAPRPSPTRGTPTRRSTPRTSTRR